jgi:hypothetical protein
MSTNNFKYDNILIKTPEFVFGGICSECEKKGVENDCEHIEPEFDNFCYDEYVSDVQSQLEKIGFESCDKYDKDRNYGGKIISRFGMEDTDGMIVWLEVVIRSGYYSGMNIDYTIDGDFGIENEQNKKQVAHYEAMHRKLDRLVKKTEEILRKNGTELTLVGVFSNGEAVYKLKK